MIKQIDITNFGSFSELVWKNSFKDKGNNVKEFQRLNIIYGRNYSGKTTLSRIFRTLEIGKLPQYVSNPSFIIYGDEGNVTGTEIANHNYDVRVYNRDFVTDNLSFLVNQQDGEEIKAFAIIGEQNKEISNNIEAIEAKLGSVEERTGLRFDLETKKNIRERTKRDYDSAFNALEAKLRNHANEGIKKNRHYGIVNYNITAIKNDIDSTKKPGFVPLTDEEQLLKLDLLRETALPDIMNRLDIKLELEPLMATAAPLLSKSISPTKPIQELLNDSILQSWVKQGIEHHRDKRDTCAFCQQNLPHDIWQTLSEHFSKESDDLETELDTVITSVEEKITEINNFVPFQSEQFYAEEKSAFDINNKILTKALDIYINDLIALKNSLVTRKNNLFQPVKPPAPLHKPQEIQDHVNAINALIVKNNDKTTNLENDKTTARNELRLSDVFNFIEDITYYRELDQIDNLKTEWETADTAYTNAHNKVRSEETAIENLRANQKDEREGAKQVNKLLNNFFGHDGIKLEPIDSPDKKTVKFEIMRGKESAYEPAYNLSEGECSLIAFCYFIAKLNDLESKDKDLIIYIDDPISSLDGNHIFFMFSLIESMITKPIKNADGANTYRYKQLFISTHNLDFLKYLKRLSMPSKKHEHFMIERNGASSNILLMPSYLKDYITEFHYLFHQIYKCRNQADANINHEPFFGFANNLRKFLEAYLFFKFPHHYDKNDPFERIKKFFGEDEGAAIALVNRLTNEHSHLAEIPDRSFKPVDIPEIASAANYVLNKIYTADSAQYNALLKSIGEPERAK